MAFLGKDDTGRYILDPNERRPSEAELWYAGRLLDNWQRHQRGELAPAKCPHIEDPCQSNRQCLGRIAWWARYFFLIEEGFMTRWDRSLREVFCGRCHATIAIGAPVLMISVNGVRRQLRRCVECAGPAPPDLPEYEPPKRPEFLEPREPGEPEPQREWMPYRED